jgi:co-chaperonin GroES (HSP10)
METKEKFSYVPYGNGVIIEFNPPKKETESGIYLPDTVDAKELLGTEYTGDIVVSVGPDCRQVSIGDKVYFNMQMTPIPLKLDGKFYLLYKEQHIDLIETK